MSATYTAVGRGMAIAVVDWLMKRLRLTELIDEPASHRVACVGSIRRERQSIGDIDLLAPMPGPQEPADHLQRALASAFRCAKPAVNPVKVVAHPSTVGTLFAVPRPREATVQPFELLRPGEAPLGELVRGGGPGFRMARVRLEAGPAPGIHVEFHRFDPGPQGNRGWIELIRTGPAEFGHAIVSRWQHVRGKPYEPGSVGGYPLDQAGNRIAVPNEDDAFKLVGIPPIFPFEREDAVARVRAMTRRDFGQRSTA